MLVPGGEVEVVQGHTEYALPAQPERWENRGRTTWRRQMLVNLVDRPKLKPKLRQKQPHNTTPQQWASE